MVGVNLDGSKTWFREDKEGVISDPDLPHSASQLLKIRVLVLIKGICRVDPPCDKLSEHVKAWTNYIEQAYRWFAMEPGVNSHQYSKSGIEFFKYSVKMGRILLSKNE